MKVANNIGRVLEGKYKLLKQLKTGGMGVVYKAEHLLLNRQIAIKLIHKECIEYPETVRRFHREAQTAASIGHDHIVDILEMGETEDGEPFIVMEYLEGYDLESLLSHLGTISEMRACHIMIQVLSALEAAHAKDIIHRDIKPANIFLINRDGVKDYVKLVDFGISKVWGNGGITQALTRTGEMLGTPPYISPEQALGEKTISAASDIWSCGVILYRMLTGHLPFFDITLAKLLVAITKEDPLHPVVHQPELSAEMSGILLRAIEKAPTERIESATAFRRLLTPFSPDTADLTGLGSTRFERQAAKIAIAWNDKIPSPAAQNAPHSRTGDIGKVRKKAVRMIVLSVMGVAVAASIFWLVLIWNRSPTPDESASGAPAPAERHDTKHAAGLSSSSSQPDDALQVNGLEGNDSSNDSPQGEKNSTLQITVNPPEATISIGGRLVGKGSRQLEIVRDDKSHEITVEAEGYRTYSQIIEYKGDISLVINLQQTEIPPLVDRRGDDRPRKKSGKSKRDPRPGSGSARDSPAQAKSRLGRIDEDDPF